MAKNALKTVTKADQALVETLFRTGSLAETARLTGMSEHEIRSYMSKPNIRDIFILEYSKILMLDLMPLAVSNMKKMLRNEAKPERNMIALCKLVLDQVGQPMSSQDPNGKPTQDMTIAQLEAFIAEKTAALKDVTPQAPHDTRQLSDMLDG